MDDWTKEDQAEFDEDLELFFDEAFRQAAEGKMGLDDVGRLFPKDVRDRNS